MYTFCCSQLYTLYIYLVVCFYFSWCILLAADSHRILWFSRDILFVLYTYIIRLVYILIAGSIDYSLWFNCSRLYTLFVDLNLAGYLVALFVYIRLYTLLYCLVIASYMPWFACTIFYSWLYTFNRMIRLHTLITWSGYSR